MVTDEETHEEQIARLGARAVVRDVLDYINEQITVVGQLNGDELRAWLYAYWISLGAFDGDHNGES